MTPLDKNTYSTFRRTALLLAFLLLLLSACQNTNDKPKPASSSPKKLSGEGGFTIDTIDRQITIKMQGADKADFKGVNQLRIQSPNKDAPLNMMAIGTHGYIDVGGDLKLSIGIVLTDFYKGDGKYTLAPNVAPSPGSTPPRVTFYADNSSGPERTLRAYDTLTKPCPIVISNKGKAGEVHCPEIRSVEKTTVSFDMTWGE